MAKPKGKSVVFLLVFVSWQTARCPACRPPKTAVLTTPRHNNPKTSKKTRKLPVWLFFYPLETQTRPLKYVLHNKEYVLHNMENGLCNIENVLCNKQYIIHIMEYVLQNMKSGPSGMECQLWGKKCIIHITY